MKLGPEYRVFSYEKRFRLQGVITGYPAGYVEVRVKLP